jgi:hypothetical protein
MAALAAQQRAAQQALAVQQPVVPVAQRRVAPAAQQRAVPVEVLARAEKAARAAQAKAAWRALVALADVPHPTQTVADAERFPRQTASAA